MEFSYLLSPVGMIQITAIDDAIVDISFVEKEKAQGSNSSILRQATTELSEYLIGKRKNFTFKMAPKGTPFQQKVWQQLLEIPYGKTTSYQEIAERVGSPKAVRAVGAANGKNPIGIVVPCHRVIGKNGKLTGYAGGLDRKLWLLELEQSIKT